jgi:hypothetical protein
VRIEETRWHVTMLTPPNYVHSQVFSDVAESLVWALLADRQAVTYQPNHLAPDAYNVVLGAHLIDPASLPLERHRGVVYNFEQLPVELPRLPHYLGWLSRWPVWDYAGRHVAWLKRATGMEAWHVPVGYVPSLTRTPPVVPDDVDVLFVGTVSERRRHILEAIVAQGLTLRVVSGLYGFGRDAWVARSRVVVSCHQYSADDPLETLRLLVTWANRGAVVAECRDLTEVPDRWRDAALWVPVGQLPAACREVAHNDALRRRLASAGFLAARAMTWDHLPEVLTRTVAWWQGH